MFGTIRGDTTHLGCAFSAFPRTTGVAWGEYAADTRAGSQGQHAKHTQQAPKPPILNDDIGVEEPLLPLSLPRVCCRRS
jgi:hypothetical protein